MEYAVFNNNLITATDVVVNYDLEKRYEEQQKSSLL